MRQIYPSAYSFLPPGALIGKYCHPPHLIFPTLGCIPAKDENNPVSSSSGGFLGKWLNF